MLYWTKDFEGVCFVMISRIPWRGWKYKIGVFSDGNLLDERFFITNEDQNAEICFLSKVWYGIRNFVLQMSSWLFAKRTRRLYSVRPESSQWEDIFFRFRVKCLLAVRKFLKSRPRSWSADTGDLTSKSIVLLPSDMTVLSIYKLFREADPDETSYETFQPTLVQRVSKESKLCRKWISVFSVKMLCATRLVDSRSFLSGIAAALPGLLHKASCRKKKQVSQTSVTFDIVLILGDALDHVCRNVSGS